MALFAFSLEPVLEHRIRLEESVQREMTAMQIRMEECEGAMKQLEQSRRERSTEMYQRLTQGMPDHERVIYAHYLQSLTGEKDRLAKIQEGLRGRQEKIRERLLHALQQRQIIEEVKKTEFSDYQLAERLAETKDLDELAQRSWRLGRGENLAAIRQDD